MRILHINTLTSGGAAKAVIRLHKGLLNFHIDSRVLFLEKVSDSGLANVGSFLDYQPISLPKKVIRKLTGYKSVQEKEKKRLDDNNFDYEYVSFPLTEKRVEDHPWIKEADLIHLHWIANFVNYPSFFKKVRKPIVWTLHDKNPFQGMCHYRNDLSVNSDGFKELEVKYLNIKYNSLSGTSNLKIVTPSSSLGAYSIKSRMFARFPHKVIPNGLELDMYKPYDKIFSRRVFNLPEDKTIFLFVSHKLKSKWKGFDLLLEALQSLQDFEDIMVCAVGKINEDCDIKNLCSIGTVQDDRLMALLYSAADAFVLPSREDNLPNTMLESMACGTPVISFPIGGMKETIIPFKNGLLTESVSATALRDELIRFLKYAERFNRQLIRDFAVEKFSLEKQAKAYIELYEEILRKYRK